MSGHGSSAHAEKLTEQVGFFERKRISPGNILPGLMR